MAINNILCVDDEEAWRNKFRERLQEITPNVDIAENCKTAMEKIRRIRYDLIVLDGLGEDCFKIIRDIKDIPHGEVVICSGDFGAYDGAQSLGIPFYNKNRLGVLDKLVAKYKPSSK